MYSIRTLILCIFISNSIDLSLQSTPADDHYIAAVVEYQNYLNANETPTENAMKNADVFVEIIKTAATKKADIVVFPEIALLGFDRTLYFEIPDPKLSIVPANIVGTDKILQKISSAAADNHIYVVINLHEIYKNGTKQYKYNTNVIFDRKGAIIARYRKYNLYGEVFLNRPTQPEYVYFDTDFGVTFGTFICFDMLFEEPAMGLVNNYNITDIIYPTAWFTELPFLMGTQVQYSWAYATNVNLLAAGFYNAKRGATGSGIYAGKKGAIINSESLINGTKLLIGQVPKMPKKGEPNTGTVEKLLPGEIIFIDKYVLTPLPTKRENISVFVTKLIEPENMKPKSIDEFIVNADTTPPIKGIKLNYQLEEQLCDGKFCCTYNLTFTTTYYQNAYNFKDDETFKKPDAYYHFNYRLATLDGIRDYVVNNTTGIQQCTIIPCLNKNLDSCALSNDGKQNFVQMKHDTLGDMTLYSTDFQIINISSSQFHNKRVLYLPNILLTSKQQSYFGSLINTDQFEFNIKNSTENALINLIIKPEKFASGGIIARLFERDNLGNGTDNGPNAASTIQSNFLLCSYFIYLLILSVIF